MIKWSHQFDSRVDGLDEDALRRRLLFLETVIATAGALLVVFDRDGRIVRFNHAIERLTGKTFEQVRARVFWEIFPLPKPIATIRQEFVALIDTQLVSTYEAYYDLADGSRRLLAWTNTVLADDEGRPEYIIAAGIDITTRKEAEQLLRGQKRVLELIATGAPMSRVLDELCKIVEARLHGAICSILLIDPLTQTLHHGGAPSLPPAFLQLIDGSPMGPQAGSCGTAAFLRKTVIVRDIAEDPLWEGYRAYALPYGLRACWSTPITGQDETVAATFAIYYREAREPTAAELDFVRQVVEPLAEIVVQRKAAEDALRQAQADQLSLAAQLRQSRDVLRTLFDGLSDGLMLLQHDGTVLAANQAAATLLDTTPTAVALTPWQQLFQDHPLRFLSDFVQATFRDGQPRHQREQYRRPQRPGQVLDIQALPLVDEAGAVQHMIVHLVDSTEQVELEVLAIQNEREAASGRLAATIAHDINTPLQSIKNCLYLAVTANAADRASYLQVAGEELDRISTVVRQMLHLHRTHHGQHVALDLRAILERVLLLTGSTMTEHGITVEAQLASHLPTLWGSPDQLTQVFLNLLLNASDAMPDGGRLCIATARAFAGGTAGGTSDAAAHIVCTITDTGSGIPAEILPHIFEPLFTTKQDEGTGLGLAITHKIIAQHRGTIDVTSTPGQGTTFTIVLPVTGEPHDHSASVG